MQLTLEDLLAKPPDFTSVFPQWDETRQKIVFVINGHGPTVAPRNDTPKGSQKEI